MFNKNFCTLHPCYFKASALVSEKRSLYNAQSQDIELIFNSTYKYLEVQTYELEWTCSTFVHKNTSMVISIMKIKND